MEYIYLLFFFFFCNLFFIQNKYYSKIYLCMQVKNHFAQDKRKVCHIKQKVGGNFNDNKDGFGN